MHLRTHVPSLVSGVVGAVVGVTLLGGVSYAATGGSFILGRSNSASTTTTLTNSAGTALSLVGKAGLPVFKVSNAVKITNLNADRLDNLDSTAFARVAARVAYIDDTLAPTPVKYDPAATADDAAMSIATCPANTFVVGGGGYQDGTPTTVLVSGPAGYNGWAFITSDPNSKPVAEAICYSPSGSAITGGTSVK